MWESLRKVPKVTIDFGDGKPVTRTANGDIATYFCTPDGHVISVLPGINTPETFMEDAMAAKILFDRSYGSNSYLERIVKEHYEWLLEGKQAVEHLKRIVSLELTKSKKWIETPIKEAVKKLFEDLKSSTITSKETLEEKLIKEDTELNKTVKKPKIYSMLLKKLLPKPKDIYKEIYKEALKCDLDDPYLGLIPSTFKFGGIN